MDQQLRQLERLAQTGDSQAQQRFWAAYERTQPFRPGLVIHLGDSGSFNVTLRGIDSPICNSYSPKMSNGIFPVRDHGLNITRLPEKVTCKKCCQMMRTG